MRRLRNAGGQGSEASAREERRRGRAARDEDARQPRSIVGRAGRRRRARARSDAQPRRHGYVSVRRCGCRVGIGCMSLTRPRPVPHGLPRSRRTGRSHGGAAALGAPSLEQPGRVPQRRNYRDAGRVWAASECVYSWRRSCRETPDLATDPWLKHRARRGAAAGSRVVQPSISRPAH